MAWMNVDESGAPEMFVDFLQVMNSLPETASYKKRSFELAGVGPGMRVLDVGCGAGEDLRVLSAMVGSSGMVVGLDKSKTMITRSRFNLSGLSNILLLSADAEKMPFSDEQFDVVRVDRVLQHLQDPVVALAEMLRVAVKGGLILAAEPDWSTIAVSEDDPTLLDALNYSICARISNPTAGRRLLRWFVESGINEVQLSAHRFTFDSFTVADQILGLNDALSFAVNHHKLSAIAARNWINRVMALDVQGQFRAAVTGHGATARRGT